MVSAWFWVGSAMPINWDISIQIPAGTQVLSSHKISGLTLAPAVPSPPQLYHLTHPGENCSDFSLSWHNKTHLFSHSTIPAFFSLSLWAVLTSSNMSPSQLASFFCLQSGIYATHQLSSSLSLVYSPPHLRCISIPKQDTYDHHRQSSCSLASPIPSSLSKISLLGHSLVQGSIALKISGPFHV